MKTFLDYLNEEKPKVDPNKLEKQITHTWNTYLTKEYKLSNARYHDVRKYTDIADSPIPNKNRDDDSEYTIKSASDKKNEIVDTIKSFLDEKSIKPTDVILTHMGNEKIDTSLFWKRAYPIEKDSSWDGTSTSKCDVMNVNKNNFLNFSVKEKGSSRLMSGNRNEMIATIFSALENMKEENYEDYLKLIDRLFANMKKLVSERKAKDITKDFKTDKASLNEKEWEVMIVKIINNTLNTELADFFENNPKFKKYFCLEAASGFYKFGKKNWTGIANYFYVIDKFTYEGEIRLIKDYLIDNKVFDNIKIRLGFKSKAEGKNYVLVNSLHALMKDDETIKTRTKNFLDYYRDFMNKKLQSDEEENSLNLENTQLEEGAILDFFKKLIDFIVMIFEKIKEYVSKSVNNFVDFFGLKENMEIEIVEDYTF